MKWKSVLFSELSNKLGDQIVGARWKGRGYFRSYTIPANPNTLKQQAHRNVLAAIVAQCQAEVLSDADYKAAWNLEALEHAISGYNLFTKYGRASKIKLAAAVGSADDPVNITYTCGIPLAKAGLFKITGETVTEVVAVGSLLAGEDNVVSSGNLAAGTYYFFIADGTVLKSGDSWPQIYQGVTKWNPNETTGAADEAKIVVT